jgi:hypothetical protein
MFKVIDITLDYQHDVRKPLHQFFKQLRRSKRTIFLRCSIWIGIAITNFLLIYSCGTLGLHNIPTTSSGQARSNLRADYGEWTIAFIPGFVSDIIEDIKLDNTQSPEVFKDPEVIDPYEGPFVNQGQVGNEEPPIIVTHQPTPTAPEPMNTRLPNRSPTTTQIVLETVTPTLTLMPPVSPTYTPAPMNTPANTPVPTNPTSPPSSTNQPLVTICHKPGGINEKTIRVPQSNLSDHITHGDYIGECANQ